MLKHVCFLTLLLSCLFVSMGCCSTGAGGSRMTYKALNNFSLPAAQSTWGILSRDGANRKVEPYLSSLVLGESGTGDAVSPVFVVGVDKITFTCCGHDGPKGEGKKNYFALVDAQSGAALRISYAPRSDPSKKLSWDVADLKGHKVRFIAHDGDGGSAFSWLGVRKINAGAGFNVDFRKGIPKGWTIKAKPVKLRTELVKGGIPFLRAASAYSILTPRRTTEIRCGFKAERLFFLGCTVARGKPLDICGHIEIVYGDGSSQSIPLIIGFTLDKEGKLLSKSKILQLHPSGIKFQYYIAIAPAPKVIKKIKLEPVHGTVYAARITAVTCETYAESKNLVPLHAGSLPAAEKEWINTHTISPASLDLKKIKHGIRVANKMELGAREGPEVLKFKRIKISDRSYEAASVFDVDKDGRKDIVSGAYWYEGPKFKKSHKIADIKFISDYWDDFSDYPMDLNGDGYKDIITGGWFGGPLRWLENPKGAEGLWKVHVIENVGSIETTRFWDVDGDGVVEAVPNASGNVIFFRLVLDANGKGTGKFTRHVVKKGGCGHGFGFGDINGDGRGDFVVPDGWIEAPKDPLTGKWTWHDDGFHFGLASVPIIVFDVNKDGKADLIVGQAHNYGLYWYEQKTGSTGKRTWIKHLIDPDSSQYHNIILSDIDNDGEMELVTGKRYHAHNGHDPGSADPLWVRYFDINKGNFVCHTLDYGPHGTASGGGIYLWVEDVDGNGWKDIVAPGKDGLYLFKNMGKR